jgi:hypothetical protein
MRGRRRAAWRTLFYSNIVIALTVAAVTGSLLYRCGFRRRISRFDSVGFFLLALILLGTQTTLNQGNDFDWFASPILAGTLAVVVIALPCFIIWELGERPPAFDLRLFAYSNYTVAVRLGRPNRTSLSGAGDTLAASDEALGSAPLRSPKKRGPFQLVPGMARAMVERLA